MTARRSKRVEYRMIAAPGGSGRMLFPTRLVCSGEGYAMVRRAGCMPFIIDEQAWADAPLREEGVKSDG